MVPVLSYNNYGQGIPAVNDERLSRLSSKSIDDLKIELKQEIQNLRQEILQNNGQASSSNINKNNQKEKWMYIISILNYFKEVNTVTFYLFVKSLHL